MTRAQVAAVKNATGIKKFILEKFKEQNESPRDFANNSNYKRQVVDDVISGLIVTPHIRRDIAKYLGRKNWTVLMREYQEEYEMEQKQEAENE